MACRFKIIFRVAFVDPSDWQCLCTVCTVLLVRGFPSLFPFKVSKPFPLSNFNSHDTRSKVSSWQHKPPIVHDWMKWSRNFPCLESTNQFLDAINYEHLRWQTINDEDDTNEKWKKQLLLLIINAVFLEPFEFEATKKNSPQAGVAAIRIAAPWFLSWTTLCKFTTLVPLVAPLLYHFCTTLVPLLYLPCTTLVQLVVLVQFSSTEPLSPFFLVFRQWFSVRSEAAKQSVVVMFVGYKSWLYNFWQLIK